MARITVPPRYLDDFRLAAAAEAQACAEMAQSGFTHEEDREGAFETIKDASQAFTQALSGDTINAKTSTLAQIFHQMATKIMLPQIAHELDTAPFEQDQAESAQQLVSALLWTIQQTAALYERAEGEGD
jgi:hypothetical protein